MAWPWKFLKLKTVFAVTTVLFVFVSSLSFATEAEMKFEKKQIVLAGKTLSVEIADTSEKMQRGLMFRKSLADNTGMLFIFPDEAPRSFWMKNTYIDLSIAFFDAAKKIVDIQEMKATSVMETAPPTYPSQHLSKYALEMPKGWFTKNKIKVGESFRFK